MKKTFIIVFILMSLFTGSADFAIAGDTEIEALTEKAQKGDAFAQYNLGLMYDNGEGVPQDYKEAVNWYRKAADQGLAEAQSNLGVMYSTGQGVAQNYKEAVKWLLKAAEQGYAEAQSNLGVMYANGRVVAQDYKEAVKWLRKAAEQGYAEAQINLGMMYAMGRHELGVAQDNIQAHKWYNLAGAADGKAAGRAREYRDKIEEEMTAGQVAQAQELARQWLAGRQNGKP